MHRLRRLGMAGYALIAVGALLVGGPPMNDALLHSPALEYLRSLTLPCVALLFVGVGLTLLAWWRLGRLAREPGGITVRQLVITVAAWVTPLALTCPIYSRDVYSYLAQGTMQTKGVSPYIQGPMFFTWLATDIPDIWRETPAPYGPVFVAVAGDVTLFTGESRWLFFYGMRTLALAGLGLMIWGIVRIARATGVDPGAALWLGAANPMVLTYLVADMHNDALMLGLMMAGLALALERRPAAGLVLVALAALVKAPAALAAVFIIPLWARQLPGPGRWARAGTAAALVTGITVVLATWVAETGYGWIFALHTPTRTHTWTSITTDLGHWTGLVAARFDLADPDVVLAAWRVAGLAAAAVVCVLLFIRHRVDDQVVGLGLGLASVLALGPVVHPWYLLWATVPLAAAARSPRIRQWVTLVTVVMTLVVLPGGVQPSVTVFAGVALGLGLVFGTAWAVRHIDRQAGLVSLVEAFRQQARPEVLRALIRRQAMALRALLPAREVAQSQQVAVDAQPGDHPGGNGRNDRTMPEGLPGMDIGDMYFDQGRGQHRTGIADGIGIV